MTSLPQSAFNAAVSPQHAKPQQTVRPISGIGAALAIVTAIVVLLLTTAGSRGANATPVSDYTAAGPKQELPQPPGGGYTDASGVAYNASTGELLVVDNRTDEILIYDGDPNWTWNRTVALGGLGIQDLEGITWMGGNKYAVSDEFGSGGGRPNELLVFTLNGTTATELYRGTLTGMPQVVNGGAEGVAFVSSAGGVDTFYAVGETGTLWRVTGQNNTLSLQQITVNDTGATPLGDFSDIAYFEADVNGVATPTIYITNQEGVSGGKVRSYTISGNTATRVGSDLTAGLTFIEGIAFNADASRMFLAGEVDIELREFTLDNAGGGDTIWTFQNVVHGGYLRQDDGSINVSMSATNDTRAQWRITSDATGTILQNVATGRYLDADGTNSGGNVDTSTDVLFDDHWVVVNNGASGFTIQNVDTNGYIDGDGVGVNVDQSISVGADDYWTRIIVNAGETPTPTPDPGPGALPNDPTVTFGAIGDWGVPDQGAPAVAALMDQANPDIIVTVGDNRYGNNSFDNVVGRHYCRWVKDAQSGPNCPSGGDADINRFFPATGNHDYTDGGGIGEQVAYFDLPGAGVPSVAPTGSELYYDVVWGPVHFFFIDSQAFKASSASETAQTNWLSAAAAASTSAASHGNDPDMQLPYDSYGIDLVLAGHDHTYERIELDTTYIVTGLGGRTPRSFASPINGSQVRYTGFNGLSLFTASATQLTGEFRSVNSNDGNNGVVDTFVLQAPVSGQQPFNGPHAIPGSVEAEDFDLGGSGVAFSDTTSSNLGGAYRSTPVDVYPTYGAPGHTVGHTRNGEWLEYTVDSATGETLEVTARVASGLASPGSLRLDIDGSTVATVPVTNTTGWWSFEGLSFGSHTFPAGESVVRITWLATGADLPKINIDRIDFTVDFGPPPACPSLAQEAEDGDVNGTVVLGSDVGASGGQFVEGAVGSFGRPGPSDDYVELCISVPAAGDYRIDARALAPNSADDSFYVSVDGGPVALWDIPINSAWATNSVSDRATVGAEIWTLTAGDHEVRFYQREDGTKLDRVELVNVNQNATCGPLTQQAENGVLSGSVATVADGNAQGGVAVEAVPGSFLQTYPSANYVELCFTVPNGAGGDYRIDGRVLAPNSLDDSFYVTVDGGPSALWHITNNPSYATDAVSDVGVDPMVYNLGAGDHVVRFYQREDGPRLDSVTLTPN